jgi:hypothetical protein
MKTRKGIWNSLESFTTPLAVLAEWELSMGAEFGKGRGFLRPAQGQAESYPCTNRPSCGLRHEVTELEGRIELRAVLRDELGQCPSIPLLPRDVVNHELDAQKLSDAICAAFEFEAAVAGAPGGALRPRRIGSWGAARTPVFLLVVGDEAGFLKELAGLRSAMPDPFILLTPTQARCTPAVDGALRQHGCAFIPLAAHLALGDGERLKVIKPIDGILAGFQARLSEGKGLVKTVERLDRNMEAIAKRDYEMQKEIEELHQLAAKGYLDFIRSAEPIDVCCFIFILAYGDRAKAARELGMVPRRFYERVDAWAGRGPEYKRMSALVKCRKTGLRKGTVPLGASLQSGGVQGDAENPQTMLAVLEQIRAGNLDQKDYPGLLQEILNALAEMNAANWRAIQGEVIGIIREEVPQ